jgi:hypothetical protein
MKDFLARLKSHVEHIKNVGAHCSTEETTKQALILPMLDILGFSPYDPTKVRAEFNADFPGAKASERVDYALFCHGVPVVFIEAKAYAEKVTNHSPQLSRYFNSSPNVPVGIITNGREWRFFTDLVHKNVMDTEPFLVIDLLDTNDTELASLRRFKYDEFEPDKLRSMAEESTYFTAFTIVISSSLRNLDIDFVRYVASKAGIQRQLTAKFLESITPIVRRSIEKAVSDMVVSGLSAPEAVQPESVPQAQDESADSGNGVKDIINPDNANIVTTVDEQTLHSYAVDILGCDAEIILKDTETYCALLYQGKVNRWLLRYRADKKVPTIEPCVSMTPERTAEIARAGLELLPSGQIRLSKPEYIYRLAGLLFDCYEYAKNDENFRIKKS